MSPPVSCIKPLKEHEAKKSWLSNVMTREIPETTLENMFSSLLGFYFWLLVPGLQRDRLLLNRRNEPIQARIEYMKGRFIGKLLLREFPCSKVWGQSKQGVVCSEEENEATSALICKLCTYDLCPELWKKKTMLQLQIGVFKVTKPAVMLTGTTSTSLWVLLHCKGLPNNFRKTLWIFSQSWTQVGCLSREILCKRQEITFIHKV